MIKHILFFDFETYYSTEFSLSKLTPPQYLLDPRCEILLCAVYDLAWEQPKIILPEDMSAFLQSYPTECTLACSFNALFDLALLAWRYGWVPTRLQDALGMARALLRLPRYNLAKVAAHLGFRDKGSTILKVKGLNANGIKQAGLWDEFCTYALEDVRLCAAIYGKLLPFFPLEEQRLLDLVLRCAIEPKFHVDISLLTEHLEALRARKQELLNHCGYGRAQLMSTAEFKKALE